MGKLAEVLLTDTRIALTFVIRTDAKPVANTFCASDLNFATLDNTKTVVDPQTKEVTITETRTRSIASIARIQNDFSRRRHQLQKHIPNPQKRHQKLRETRNRQHHRVTNALHQQSTTTIRENPDTSFIFENLTNIRESTPKGTKSKKFRTYLHRWPFRLYQHMIDYKSAYKTIYVNPRGTSTYCPVCGDQRSRLKHPTWGESLSGSCAEDYDRNRLARLAISVRGHQLCGSPFTVSENASWQAMKNEYRYTQSSPERLRAGGTKSAHASNKNTKV